MDINKQQKKCLPFNPSSFWHLCKWTIMWMLFDIVPFPWKRNVNYMYVKHMHNLFPHGMVINHKVKYWITLCKRQCTKKQKKQSHHFGTLSTATSCPWDVCSTWRGGWRGRRRRPRTWGRAARGRARGAWRPCRGPRGSRRGRARRGCSSTAPRSSSRCAPATTTRSQPE